ncbi:MAG: hypothetical protein KAG84_00340 [Bacteroidales bacterium]|nr:hypothetical protein [Bacteroidales bacterium]
MNIRTLVLIVIAMLILSIQSMACTVAVISGKYTKDGRPLLWKNRDTWAIKNKIVYFNDAKYEYMGLVNSHDSKGKSVWIGQNEMGFSIMNSASYNLNIGDTTRLNGQEGRIIKKALANCATIEDFEKMLDEMPRPTRLEANFGVIDANGGAAMYELNNKGYVKFDANDPTVAPFGYVLRANYSFTGSFGKESSGYIRYNTVDDLFYNAMATNTFDAKFIMQDVTRGLKHSMLNIDLYQQYSDIPENTTTYTFFHDFIPRNSSASSCVIQGVKKDENPDLSTLWSIVGFPLTSIAIPTWVKAKDAFPSVLKYNEEYKNSPVCYAALELKNEVFPVRWGKFATKYYININALTNADNTGIVQKINPFENKIFEAADLIIADARANNKLDLSKVKDFYNSTDELVHKMFQEEFNIELK